MAKYELLTTVQIPACKAQLRKYSMPELVHLNDPALAVMTDFSQNQPHTITPDENIDTALHQMKAQGVHLLLVEDNSHGIIGVVVSEDLLGEKPIKIIQDRRISRSHLLIKMLMTPLEKITAFDIQTVEQARVGNIVNTLKDFDQHYALVIATDETKDTTTIRGIFTTSQLSRQLHMEITGPLNEVKSLSELQHRTQD